MSYNSNLIDSAILAPCGGILLHRCKALWDTLQSSTIPSSFSSPVLHSLFLLPGQIQEVTLGPEESGAQVEVTPELDLEVVPEASGDWHSVFP